MSAELEAVNLVAPKVPNQKLHLEKWQAAAAKAGATWKMANTLAKALAQRTSKRWQFVDFLGPKGRESAGVVDILAIRKASSVPDGPLLKRYDLFDIYLIQVKGGSARMPSMAEMLRLRDVQNEYNAKGIILFQWQTNVKSGFYLLNLENFVWEQKSTASLFGT
ncbi:MAG: hypothetical protein EON56_00035 [Alphaproteobacteria bacterium]|nr:MAG: hypothetical protein EON56_00035 [Alphaproteobacteria bacterium]